MRISPIDAVPAISGATCLASNLIPEILQMYTGLLPISNQAYFCFRGFLPRVAHTQWFGAQDLGVSEKSALLNPIN